jgi:hypothetical protein
MTAQTQPAPTTPEDFLAMGKRVGLQMLEACETGANAFADYQDRIAESTPVEWIATATRAQANFTREVTRVYGNTTRELLK